MNIEIGHRHVVKVLLRADGQGIDGDGDDQERSVEARPGPLRLMQVMRHGARRSGS